MRLDQINDLLNRDAARPIPQAAAAAMRLANVTPDLARRLHRHATGEIGFLADLLLVLYRQVQLQNQNPLQTDCQSTAHLQTGPIDTQTAARPFLHHKFKFPSEENITTGSIVSRRRFIKSGSLLLAAPAILRTNRASAQNKVFKIGLVSPLTGPLARFGEAQDWIIAGIQEAINGLANNGAPVRIELIAKDRQSNPNRAAEVASALILNDGVNLILTKDTPDTTNPVCDQAELNEIPCISPIARGSPGSLAAAAIRKWGSTIPITSSGGWKTSSPTSPRSGTSRVRRRRSAGCFPMMPMAMPGATRRSVCRGRWRRRALNGSIPVVISR